MYFWGAQVASIQSRWAFLRENATPSVPSPFTFYSPLLQTSRIYGSPLIFPTPPRSFFRFFFTNFPVASLGTSVSFCLLSRQFYTWKFRNKTTFHNGKENSKAIKQYIEQDIKKRILLDKHQLSPTMFHDLWSHPALCSFRDNNKLVFNF